MTYPHSGILLSLQKEGNSEPATTWINFEDMMLSKLSQSQKENPV